MKLKPHEYAIMLNQILIMKALRNLIGNLNPNRVGSQGVHDDLKIRIENTQQFVDSH